MIESIRIIAEAIGWYVILVCAYYAVLFHWRKLRNRVVIRMADTARGFMDGGVAAGMHRWADVGDMVLVGESGILSYAPKATGSLATEMDGPAIQMLGIAGQDRTVGMATMFWCEGPPSNRPYAKMVFRRVSILQRKIILPIGYDYGFRVGSKMAAKTFHVPKPDDNQKWVTP